MKYSLNHKGFTLMELLTVIGILSIVGIICVSVVSLTLRTTKKTDLLEYARINGDNALTEMVRSIRYAQTLTSPATCTTTTTVSSITITSLLDHQPTTYSCSGNTISSNSASLIDTNSLQIPSNLSTCSFTCSQPAAAVPPLITIQFILSPKTTGTGNFAETNFTLPFQSSVTLRNY